MRLSGLVVGRLVRRYKRFFADVELGGEVVTAHCANPGSMRGCLEVGGRVWLSESSSASRKLRYSWELAEVAGARLCVHTGRANDVVAEALAAGRIAELAAWPEVQREVRFGARSRVDFVLARGDARHHVEVKTVTLSRGDGRCAFPDSVTERGTRHLGELAALAAAGHRATLLFVVARSDGRRVEPADDLDPVYGVALRQAAAAGVAILAYGCTVEPDELTLAGPLPVELSPLPAAPSIRPGAIATKARARSKASRRRAPIG